MKKENQPIVNGVQPIIRVTRAQALNQKDQTRLIGMRSKRNSLEENMTNACVAVPGPNKKRVVLKDVTNVLCANSYKNCLNASKITRTITNQKQIKKCSLKVSKVVPSDVENIGQLPGDTREKCAQETAKHQISSSKNEPTKKVKSNIDIQLSIENAEASLPVDLGKQSMNLTSNALIFSMRGKKLEKVGFYEKLLMPQNSDVTDVDSDLKDPILCSFYAPDIYVNLRVAELIRRPTCDFMETVQRDITQSMRRILVDWLVEVSEEYKLVPDTLYLTVHLIDLFLSQNYIEKQRLQLLGITCMLIASKYEEICAPSIEELCFITNNTYTNEEVLVFEIKVLNYLGFRLCAPTSITFLRRYLRVAQASYEASGLELEFLANYLAELTLVDYELLKFLPSIIAASVVFLARWTLYQSGHPWNATLEYYTCYKASDIKTTVLKLQSLQLNSAGCPLNAIRAKYKQDKFKAVAALTSPELIQSLF